MTFKRCVRLDHLYVANNRQNQRDAITNKRITRFTKSILTPGQALEIRRRYASEHIYQKVLAAEYGVSPSTISAITRGAIWPESRIAAVGI
jgi:hypothetical protein